MTGGKMMMLCIGIRIGRGPVEEKQIVKSDDK